MILFNKRDSSVNIILRFLSQSSSPTFLEEKILQTAQRLYKQAFKY